jgi:hypothetical protein
MHFALFFCGIKVLVGLACETSSNKVDAQYIEL